MKKILASYSVPLFFFLVALFVAAGKPNEKISTRIPLVPGQYQYEFALGAAVIGAVLACVVWLGHRKSRRSE